MSKEFAESLLSLFKKNKAKSSSFQNNIDILLRRYLIDNSQYIDSVLENYFLNEKVLTEKDLRFALELATAVRKKKTISDKLFDIVLDKPLSKCSDEFKAILMSHFAHREISVFEKYIANVLNPKHELFVGLQKNSEKIKYLTKKIAINKLKLTPNQAEFLINQLSKIDITMEAQYFVYLNLLDYLGKFNTKAYQVFESKHNDLYSLDNKTYIVTTPDVVIKILKACSNAESRYSMAKKFLMEPYCNNKAIQRAVSQKIPEIKKLINFK